MVTATRKAQRGGNVQWIYASLMQVSHHAQRPFRKAHAVKIAAEFDPDVMGIPVLSFRDNVYWIMDGQHRIEAARMNDYGDYAFQCDVYEGLTEQEEAQMFRRLNDSKNVTAYDDFRIATFGGEEPQLSITKAVEKLDLRVSQGGSGISAVGSLMAAWNQVGEANFVRAMRILRDGFDYDVLAFKAEMIRGMAMFVQRYGSHLKDENLIKKFKEMRGGPNKVMQKAASIQLSTDRGLPDCVASAIVGVYNRSAGRGALENWWK